VGHFLASGDQEKALANAKTIEDILGAGNFFLEIQEDDPERGTELTAAYGGAFKEERNTACRHK
jgi:hypothetical protein